MIPATCVPWPLSSYGRGAAVDEVHERRDALAVLHPDSGRSPLIGEVVVPGGHT
jgi:hypothetical protein